MILRLGLILIALTFLSCGNNDLVSDNTSGVDHIYVANERGELVSVSGSWKLIEVTGADSVLHDRLNSILTLPTNPVSRVQENHGNIKDEKGFIWTKCNVVTPEGIHLVFLERLVEETLPQIRFNVYAIDEKGMTILSYPELPIHNNSKNVILKWIRIK